MFKWWVNSSLTWLQSDCFGWTGMNISFCFNMYWKFRFYLSQVVFSSCSLFYFWVAVLLHAVIQCKFPVIIALEYIDLKRYCMFATFYGGYINLDAIFNYLHSECKFARIIFCQTLIFVKKYGLAEASDQDTVFSICFCGTWVFSLNYLYNSLKL